MRNGIEIENIEDMRRREGIHDVELRREIRELARGDCVKLTFLTGAKSFPGETLMVRITSIRGNIFRGKLARTPSSGRLSALHIGSGVIFKGDHIHSVTRERGPEKE